MYLRDTTVCVLWPAEGKFDMQMNNLVDSCAVININTNNLNNSFVKDVGDFESLVNQFDDSGIYYNDLTLKLTLAIEKAHCEVNS